jgi:glycosyltransferase involved in cell wall biosynthesis
MESLRSALQTEDSLRLGVAAPGAKPFETFEAEGVRYFHLEYPPARGGFGGVADRWGHRYVDSPVLAQALAVVDSFEPDLIHVHGSEGPIGLLSQMVDLPVLISLQGLLIAVSRFYLAGIPVAEVLRDVISPRFAKGWGLVHSWWDLRIAAQRELKILRSARYFTGRTDWDRAVLSVVNPTATYYHADEVLRPEFYGNEWRSAPDGPVVVYTTGHEAPYKGLVNLLEAVALFRESVEREVQLRVSGRILGTSMWPIARRATVRLGLENAIAWLGPLGPAAIVSELKAASVYVHASLVDNSPNALAEAMMVGVPCVASSAGGVPSMIADGVDGLLHAPNDAYGLAGRIASVASDAALATRLGENARARAQRRHDPRAIARETLDIYADVLARHRLGER